MNHKVFYLFIFLATFSQLFAKDDSICGTPLRYQVLSTNEPTEGFFWIAADKKYNVYYKGADFILEQNKKNILWLINGAGIYPGQASEVYIDTVYFKNTSENSIKELVIGYSVYHDRPDNYGKSKYIAIIDIRDKIVLLNIAIYDHRLEKDENGKFTEYLYECDAEFFHDEIRIETSDDSDINNAQTQLDDGVYKRKGHCYISH